MQAQQAEEKDSFFSVRNNNIPNKKHLYWYPARKDMTQLLTFHVQNKLS